MKLQFAIFEATISAVFLFSLISLMAVYISAYSAKYQNNSVRLIDTYASYDFIRQATYNFSMHQCIYGTIYENSSCLANYFGYYKNAYGINNIRLYHAGSAKNTIQRMETTCFPYFYNRSELTLCIGVD